MNSFTGNILITGASGQLGSLIVQALLRRVAPQRIIATARDPHALADFAARGVVVREADYSRPPTLATALADVQRVLLVSSSAIGQRVEQHRNVISAAVQAGVQLLGYTSVLHADRSSLQLAQEHRETEALLRASGLPHVLLRNGWYTENLTAFAGSALAHGAVLGSAGQGVLSTAARADYAEAAAVVLTADDPAGQVHELAGDNGFTLTEYAAELARLSGRDVAYQDLPEAQYRAALLQAGLPAGLAGLLAQSDAAAAQGALFDDSRQLSGLIGRPTTDWRSSLQVALAG